MQEELYKRFSGKMYAVCLRYANNADDAQDLLQEGFIKVYRNLHRFRAEGSFEGWIRRVFVNSSIEHFRKKALQLSKVSDKEENTIEDTGYYRGHGDAFKREGHQFARFFGMKRRGDIQPCCFRRIDGSVFKC